MTLVSLALIGLIAGWLVSVIAREEEREAILRLMTVGALGSLGVGVPLAGGSMISSPTLAALAAALAAALLLGGAYLWLHRRYPDW